jgi:hypothetical protein
VQQTVSRNQSAKIKGLQAPITTITTTTTTTNNNNNNTHLQCNTLKHFSY